jgi:hypothetical protein
MHAQDAAARSQDDAVVHTQDVTGFPRNQRAAAATRVLVICAKVTHAEDAVVASHAHGIDIEVIVTTE